MKDPAARRAAFEAAGAGARPAFFLSQVHGTEIVAVGAAAPPAEAPKADGLVTNAAGVVLCVFVADCVPLFLWEKSGKAVGVFHAGWRGAADGMPRRAVESFRLHYGIEPADLRASVGPHIKACCFRVGPETAARFSAESLVERDGGVFVDLEREVLAQLSGAGVVAAAQAECTSCGKNEFFSYRREKTDQRMMAFITLNP